MGECLHSAGVVENEDEVCEFEADLSTESTSYSSDSGGCRPRSISQSCDYNSTTEATAAQETGFEDCEDCQTFGVGEDLWWDDLIGTECLFWVDE